MLPFVIKFGESDLKLSYKNFWKISVIRPFDDPLIGGKETV